MTRLGMLAAAAALALAGMHAPAAHADAIDELGKDLVEIESEVSILSQNVRRPSTLGQSTASGDLASRRLIDAQVNFGIGNYDDAAVMLYDFVEKNPNNPSWDEGLYYLAESLYQKGDYVASGSYFTRLVEERGTRSKYYQQALERLIELTLELDDATDVERWLGALDQVPQGELRASVPYVRGKYAYYRDDFDDAISWFTRVPKGSKYYFQAQYFIGVAQVAKGQLGPAADVYLALLRVDPTTDDARRVEELTHMALGRLYYERDQPSKAIDQYLEISRHSDLFDEALYEVAWVYVKNKEFDKALRALELLALADPTSQRMPEVRILEGNLRIRKAQGIAETGKGNSAEEYERALEVFEGTREAFREPQAELVRIAAEDNNPRLYLAQITGRHSEAFDTESAALPEVAAAWLRQQPEVERVIGIESDLGQIDAEIDAAERTIARLDAALSSPSRVNIFPDLAEKRVRSTEILEEMFSIRTQLATHERALVSRYASAGERAELERLQTQRQAISRELEELPDAGVEESERIDLAQNEFTALDQRSAEVATMIQTSEAQLVALEKYVRDQGVDLDVPEMQGMREMLTELRTEIDSMQEELVEIRREGTLARDQAGTGDEVAMRRDDLRSRLRAALDDEHRYLSSLRGKMSGSDRTKAEQIATLTQKANSLTVELDSLNGTIDGVVDQALAEVRSALSEEKAKLAAYEQEFSGYELESRTLGGEILGLSFGEVAKRFYEILVRSDVGVVDVAWSIKESADEAVRRLTLDQARERRTLDAEFSDVIREMRQAREDRAAQDRQGDQK